MNFIERFNKITNPITSWKGAGIILFDKDKIDKLIYFLKNNLNKKELSLKIKQNLDILEWHKNI